MDSLFRRYYIPKLVIREVRLSEHQTVNEIIDGQQRITTVQDFFDNKYSLPKSLKDVDATLPGLYYKDLDSDIRKFIDKSLKYQSDIIKNIDSPHTVEHQIIATEIFWRLQQGESLNYMEVAHAQLSSLTRNFIVKYSDDQTFDYENYAPLDSNPDKMRFFSLLSVDNNRMRHLQFMAMRQVFFQYLRDNNLEVIEKDGKRGFTELERIIIYREGKGLCQQCLRENKPESEARVGWSKYQADHVIPHARGGKTTLENGELLCSYHNQSKGASLPSNV